MTVKRILVISYEHLSEVKVNMNGLYMYNKMSPYSNSNYLSSTVITNYYCGVELTCTVLTVKTTVELLTVVWKWNYYVIIVLYSEIY